LLPLVVVPAGQFEMHWLVPVADVFAGQAEKQTACAPTIPAVVPAAQLVKQAPPVNVVPAAQAPKH